MNEANGRFGGRGAEREMRGAELSLQELSRQGTAQTCAGTARICYRCLELKVKQLREDRTWAMETHS